MYISHWRSRYVVSNDGGVVGLGLRLGLGNGSEGMAQLTCVY